MSNIVHVIEAKHPKSTPDDEIWVLVGAYNDENIAYDAMCCHVSFFGGGKTAYRQREVTVLDYTGFER